MPLRDTSIDQYCRPAPPSSASTSITHLHPTAPPPTPDADRQALLLLIAQSRKTPFQKRVLSLLLQIPPGRVTSYALLSAHLGSSPRAVGNALRRNPFAPGVPCHRVVATGGGLGGFKGEWPRRTSKSKTCRGAAEGATIAEKRRMLRGEGVRFDAGGRVLGTPFSGFVG